MDNVFSATPDHIPLSDPGDWQEPDPHHHSSIPSTQTASSLHLRQVGINPNHWYVVARSSEVTQKPLPVTLWHQRILLYRDSHGQIRALEDRCPHRQVQLSEGQVRGDEVECAYHGWRFNAAGQCSAVPYLMENQKLPSCKIRAYPVQERDGFIWLFPGSEEILREKNIQPMGVPEWDHLNYIGSVAVIDCNAHYSFLIENLMDMYHGHLHDNYQAWANPKLDHIDESGDRIHAYYNAESYYRIDKIWSVSQLFIPALRRLHPELLTVSYLYPHWASTLGQDFKIYCLPCPISETHTRAYLLHFTSLEAFPRLHKLSEGFRRRMKNLFFGSAKKLLEGLIVQDVLMIEQEQRAYEENQNQRSYELNRAIASVQRLIRQQAEAGQQEAG